MREFFSTPSDQFSQKPYHLVSLALHTRAAMHIIPVEGEAVLGHTTLGHRQRSMGMPCSGMTVMVPVAG